MKNFAKLAGIISTIIGLMMIIGSLWAVTTITGQLKDERITVPADASCEAGKPVNGPVSAFCQAEIIKKHSLGGDAEGMTYAELGAKAAEAKKAGDTATAEKYTKARTSAMNASFLRSSLFTSVLGYGVSALAAGTGLCLSLLGLGLLQLAKLFRDRDQDQEVHTTTSTKPLVTHKVTAPTAPTAKVADGATATTTTTHSTVTK